MLRKLLAPLIAVLALAGCGGGNSSRHLTSSSNCPQAANGHGEMGACAPKTYGLSLPKVSVPAGPRYPDRSNNDPCYCGQAIRSGGYSGLIVKANQGTGFIDRTAVGMIASARAAGLAVGMYDFDQDYSIDEVRVFAARLRAAGILPSTRNTFPAYLDVEYGRFSLAGLRAQIAYLRALGYRVGIYTGNWYWAPHAGCTWPAGITAWLSGYPVAPVPCGLPLGLYVAHQYTSTPIDLSVFRGSQGAFAAFVNSGPAPSPRLICFGPKAKLRNSTCERVRPLLSRYSRARASTGRALARNGCERPYRRPGCRVLGQRWGYFDRRARTLFGRYA